jgi:hypothetical protein
MTWWLEGLSNAYVRTDFIHNSLLFSVIIQLLTCSRTQAAHTGVAVNLITFVLCSSIFMTLLQMFWGYKIVCILASIAMGGSADDQEKKKKKEQ